jgi:hypothetical protein
MEIPNRVSESEVMKNFPYSKQCVKVLLKYKVLNTTGFGDILGHQKLKEFFESSCHCKSCVTKMFNK